MTDIETRIKENTAKLEFLFECNDTIMVCINDKIRMGKNTQEMEIKKDSCEKRIAETIVIKHGLMDECYNHIHDCNEKIAEVTRNIHKLENLIEINCCDGIFVEKTRDEINDYRKYIDDVFIRSQLSYIEKYNNLTGENLKLVDMPFIQSI